MPTKLDEVNVKPKDKEWLKGRNKFHSGYCNGYGKTPCHEGTRPKSRSGKPLKTCPMWDSCPCICHYNIDKMYESIGSPRITEQPNPEYTPEVAHFVMPEEPIPHVDTTPSNNGGPIDRPIDEGIPTPPPVTPQRAPLPPTPTGRRHRGELEYQVLNAVNAWGGEDVHGYCTPKLIAEWIATTYTIPTPSTGAIQAVWNRWESMGIAEQAKKPARFVTWVGDFDGSATALARIKAQKKRAKRSAKSAAARGFR